MRLSCDGSEKEPNRLSPQAFLKGLEPTPRWTRWPITRTRPGPTPKGSETTIDLTNFSDLFTAIDATIRWKAGLGHRVRLADEALGRPGVQRHAAEQAENIAAAFVTLRSDPRVGWGPITVRDNVSSTPVCGTRPSDGSGASAHALPMQAAPTTVLLRGRRDRTGAADREGDGGHAKMAPLTGTGGGPCRSSRRVRTERPRSSCTRPNRWSSGRGGGPRPGRRTAVDGRRGPLTVG